MAETPPASDVPPDTKPVRGRRREAVKTFLYADRAPMWFTAAALLAGAGGTYFLAPQINAKFEAQKIKTDFVIRNYNDLRAKMEDFQGLYLVATQKLAAGEDVGPDILKLREIMGRYSAQGLALVPMFTVASGSQSIADVNYAMNDMIGVLVANNGKTLGSDPAAMTAYNAQVVEALGKLAVPLMELYVRIGEVGQLKPTEMNVEPEQK